MRPGKYRRLVKAGWTPPPDYSAVKRLVIEWVNEEEAYARNRAIDRDRALQNEDAIERFEEGGHRCPDCGSEETYSEKEVDETYEIAYERGKRAGCAEPRTDEEARERVSASHRGRDAAVEVILAYRRCLDLGLDELGDPIPANRDQLTFAVETLDDIVRELRS